MNIKDGDYFNYSYKTGLGPSTDRYWCRDRRCVARTDNHGDIVLIDTYNYWPFKEREYDTDIFTYSGLAREYSKYVTEDKFDLEFICNLNDYEYVKDYEKDDYENVIFVGYQCDRLWAKPKGAQPSKAAILKKLQGQLQRAHEDLRSAQSSIERITKDIEELK